MSTVENLVLGLLIERRESTSAWERWEWRATAVIPGTHAGENGDGWRKLRDDGRQAIFHAGHLALRLYPDEAGAYLENVGRLQPELYVVLRPHEDAPSGPPVRPLLLTASPDEAAAYSEAEAGVHPVPMPPAVAALVRRFALAHRRPEPFVRRSRREREAREAAARPPRGGAARRRPAWEAPGSS